eukprot:2788198-Prorocentrum_lima.AAC.1
MSGSHQEPDDDAGFFAVTNDFKLPPGIVPQPGFHNVKNDFKPPPGPVPEPGFHEVKNTSKLPAQGPENHGGPE